MLGVSIILCAIHAFCSFNPYNNQNFQDLSLPRWFLNLELKKKKDRLHTYDMNISSSSYLSYKCIYIYIYIHIHIYIYIYIFSQNYWDGIPAEMKTWNQGRHRREFLPALTLWGFWSSGVNYVHFITLYYFTGLLWRLHDNTCKEFKRVAGI